MSLKLHPKDHLIYFNRAEAYVEIKNYRKAKRDYFNSMKYNNKMNLFEKLENGEIYYGIGYCFQELNKTKKAEKYFEKAKDLGYDNDK